MRTPYPCHGTSNPGNVDYASLCSTPLPARPRFIWQLPDVRVTVGTIWATSPWIRSWRYSAAQKSRLTNVLARKRSLMGEARGVWPQFPATLGALQNNRGPTLTMGTYEIVFTGPWVLWFWPRCRWSPERDLGSAATEDDQKTLRLLARFFWG